MKQNIIQTFIKFTRTIQLSISKIVRKDYDYMLYHIDSNITQEKKEK